MSHKRHTRSGSTTLVIAAGLVLLLVLGGSSFSAMLGDINASQAQRLERRWERNPAMIDQTQWQVAESYLQSALMYSPGHPDYLQAVGRLSSWFLLIPEAQSQGHLNRDEQIKQGLIHFREAVKQRPYWAYGWSELALLKAQSGQIDDEFSHAVRAATELGPIEKQVLQNVLNAGLGAWPQLGLMQRIEVHSLFRRMLTMGWAANSALALVESNGMKKAFCLGVEEDPNVSQGIKRRCLR